ncbi:MAG: ribonuclease HI family protein [Vicinamibacterales bacterium]
MSGQPRRPRVLIPAVPPADITLVFDGGSLGNPGQGYGSFVYHGLIETKAPIRLEYPGTTTSNEAEYLSLLHALRTILRELDRAARDAATTSINVLSDSKLVVEQVSGRWKVRHAPLRPLHAEALDLLSQFASWRLDWQPRLESVRLLGH